MNWLETHLREFVFPVLKLYARQKKNCNTQGKEWNNEADPFTLGTLLQRKLLQRENAILCPPKDQIVPVTSELRPRSFETRIPVEAQLLSTALLSYGLMKDVTWQVDAILNAKPGGRLPQKWALAGSRQLTQINRAYSVEDHAHWYLKTCVKTIRTRLKDTNKQVILLGRDVWLISVLCHKLGVPHVYDPRVSRNVATSEAMKGLLPEYCLREGDILFDTGFAGSIHRAVEDHSAMKLDNLMMSATHKENQIFPNSGIARNYALFFEYLPKYFKTGMTRDGEVVQYMADFPEFVEAAMGTIWAWHHESPAVMVSENPNSLARKRMSIWSYYS